jgi:hypothetical protein
VSDNSLVSCPVLILTLSCDPSLQFLGITVTESLSQAGAALPTCRWFPGQDPFELLQKNPALL